MIEKTLLTMHTDNNILQEQYRERQYTRYSDLIAVLGMAEARRKIMWHNQNKRPAETGGNFANKGSPFIKRKPFQKGKGKWYPNYKTQMNNDVRKRKFQNKKPKPNDGTKCFRCGITGHWASECRIAKHLVDLYVASQKGKGKDIETNLIEDNTHVPTLDVADYLVDDIEDVAGPSV
ncbi:hypothetical protein RND81_06G050500 [Saponaria officinalis]|uniref:CCHC-type domain-containing protein n=1 Tax=Saponaria officinalis TaxID=3572 RepID=A0AAW1K7L1_SAPOF